MNHLFEQHFTNKILNELCAAYELNPEVAKLIKEDSNLIYDCGESILRISYSAIRSARDMEVELDWLAYLYQEGVPVVRIIPSSTGQRLERTGNADGHFTAVRFEKIVGHKISKETWNAGHFQKLGRLTGQIHRVSREYPYRDDLTYHHWDELVECSYANLLPNDERKLRQLHDRLVAEFKGYDRTPDNYGLIHNDIHFENYLLAVPDNKIVLFDFEVACQSWHLYEIATALYYACFLNRKRNDEEFEHLFLENFLIGYRREYPLEPVDFELLLKFMLYRDIHLLGYFAALWEHKERPESIQRHISRIEVSVAVRRVRLGW